MRYGGKGPLPRRFCARCLEVADCYRSLLIAIVLVLVVYRIRRQCVSIYEGSQWQWQWQWPLRSNLNDFVGVNDTR